MTILVQKTAKNVRKRARVLQLRKNVSVKNVRIGSPGENVAVKKRMTRIQKRLCRDICKKPSKCTELTFTTTD